MDKVIEAFIHKGRSFLVRSFGETSDNPVIDISHERLIRQWKKLGEWVDEEAANAKTYRRLVETAELHTPITPRFYREADLAQALKWRQGHEKAEIAKQKAELTIQEATIAKKRAKQERRTLKITSLFAVLMLFLAIYAGFESKRANRATERANNLTLAANLETARAFEGNAVRALKDTPNGHIQSEYQKAWLYALQASQVNVAKEKIPLQLSTIAAFAGTEIQQAFVEEWFSPALNIGRVSAVAFSPDGMTLVSGSRDNTLRLWVFAGYLLLNALTDDPFLTARVLDALQFLWERSLKDDNIANIPFMSLSNRNYLHFLFVFGFHNYAGQDARFAGALLESIVQR
ncbi:MAG: hypothetical protein GY799_07425 [Desulfobulbaceae bacterium]|nr:hypothetical protein [Desulfobulbaceae bacterium]